MLAARRCPVGFEPARPGARWHRERCGTIADQPGCHRAPVANEPARASGQPVAAALRACEVFPVVVSLAARVANRRETRADGPVYRGSRTGLGDRVPAYAGGD